MAVARFTFSGLFLITLATMMYEILLTRIFSVTMFYHFAFVAVSIALFGMTVGAVLVYVFPRYFSAERTERHLALGSWLFSLTIVISFLTHLTIPFITRKSLVAFYAIGLNYVVISIPFVLSGIVVCLALTRFPRSVSKLYAADLAGAALGCILVVATLQMVDGPTSVFIAALLAAAGALAFSRGHNAASLARPATGLIVVLAAFITINAIGSSRQSPILRLLWVKEQIETPPLYEKWNSFSRLRVMGDPNARGAPFGWGLSNQQPLREDIRQLMIDIDASAGTVLTGFDGDVTVLDHLKHDVTNVVHYLRPGARVFVVGTGGGRDILSALAFGQQEVVGVEINRNIIDTVNKRFGDFTGHLDRDPRVHFVNDEARSFLAREASTYDILQISLIDTWAATSAGAFVLTENSLYTLEAWELFLRRLNPGGILSVSRWYFADRPAEVYRLVALATASLARLGVEHPGDHMMVIYHLNKNQSGIDPDGVGTLLLGNSPFSSADIDSLEQVVAREGFHLALSPRHAPDPTMAELTSPEGLSQVIESFPLDIAPPTDNRPFFFHMLRLKDMFKSDLQNQGAFSFNVKAVFVLGALLITVITLTVLCILVPLALTTRRETLRGSLPIFLFFVGIGFGFLLVEISQMQRLIIFLGHPVYGLAVVLFSLLLASGIGSLTTQKTSVVAAKFRLLLLLAALAIFGLATPMLIEQFAAAATPTRILAAVGILMPLGICMGMAFPLGMKVAATHAAPLAPWLWGINGATSVCASVVAVAIALTFSISTSYWVGFAFYLVAVGAYWLIVRRVAHLAGPHAATE